MGTIETRVKEEYDTVSWRNNLKFSMRTVFLQVGVSARLLLNVVLVSGRYHYAPLPVPSRISPCTLLMTELKVSKGSFALSRHSWNSCVPSSTCTGLRQEIFSLLTASNSVSSFSISCSGRKPSLPRYKRSTNDPDYKKPCKCPSISSDHTSALLRFLYYLCTGVSRVSSLKLSSLSPDKESHESPPHHWCLSHQLAN